MSQQLTQADKELFLKVWNLEDGELTDEEISMALSLGLC
jgi:hypothetical protein